jgi:hypothetical protein
MCLGSSMNPMNLLALNCWFRCGIFRSVLFLIRMTFNDSPYLTVLLDIVVGNMLFVHVIKYFSNLDQARMPRNIYTYSFHGSSFFCCLFYPNNDQLISNTIYASILFCT